MVNCHVEDNCLNVKFLEPNFVIVLYHFKFINNFKLNIKIHKILSTSPRRRLRQCVTCCLFLLVLDTMTTSSLELNFTKFCAKNFSYSYYS